MEEENYPEPRIAEKNSSIPRWLIWSYILVPLWGLLWFWLYWNGSEGVLDPGHWRQLQEAAHTTDVSLEPNK